MNDIEASLTASIRSQKSAKDDERPKADEMTSLMANVKRKATMSNGADAVSAKAKKPKGNKG